MKLFYFIFLSAFFFNSKAQSPTKVTAGKEDLFDKIINAGAKIIDNMPDCGMCSSIGKVKCSNCDKWSSEYKKKVACHDCRDTRKISCRFCSGTGKFMKQDLIYSQEDLDRYLDQNQPPSAAYPARPVQDRTKYIEISKIPSQDYATMEKSEKEKRKVAEETEMQTQVKELIKVYSNDSFNVRADLNTKSIRITRLSSGVSFSVSSYKIENGFVVNGNGHIYNKNGELVYSSDAPCYTFCFNEKNGNKQSYLYVSRNGYIIIGDYKGEIILHGSDAKMELFAASSAEVFKTLDISKYDNDQFLVARIISDDTRDLANIQHNYQLIDLATGLKTSKLNLHALKGKIKKAVNKSSLVESLR